MWKIIKIILFILFFPISLPVWLIMKLFSRGTKEYRLFIKKGMRVNDGMSQNAIVNIMGSPNSREIDGDKLILIWEQSQRNKKNGDFIKRRLKVTFVNDIATSITRENFDIDPKRV